MFTLKQPGAVGSDASPIETRGVPPSANEYNNCPLCSPSDPLENEGRKYKGPTGQRNQCSNDPCSTFFPAGTFHAPLFGSAAVRWVNAGIAHPCETTQATANDAGLGNATQWLHPHLVFETKWARSTQVGWEREPSITHREYDATGCVASVSVVLMATGSSTGIAVVTEVCGTKLVQPIVVCAADAMALATEVLKQTNATVTPYRGLKVTLKLGSRSKGGAITNITVNPLSAPPASFAPSASPVPPAATAPPTKLTLFDAANKKTYEIPLPALTDAPTFTTTDSEPGVMIGGSLQRPAKVEAAKVVVTTGTCVGKDIEVQQDGVRVKIDRVPASSRSAASLFPERTDRGARFANPIFIDLGTSHMVAVADTTETAPGEAPVDAGPVHREVELMLTDGTPRVRATGADGKQAPPTTGVGITVVDSPKLRFSRGVGTEAEQDAALKENLRDIVAAAELKFGIKAQTLVLTYPPSHRGERLERWKALAHDVTSGVELWPAPGVPSSTGCASTGDVQVCFRLPEPLAAFYAAVYAGECGVHEQVSEHMGIRNWLLFDLGAGTTDVAVLTLEQPLRPPPEGITGQIGLTCLSATTTEGGAFAGRDADVLMLMALAAGALTAGVTGPQPASAVEVRRGADWAAPRAAGSPFNGGDVTFPTWASGVPSSTVYADTTEQTRTALKLAEACKIALLDHGADVRVRLGSAHVVVKKDDYLAALRERLEIVKAATARALLRAGLLEPQTLPPLGVIFAGGAYWQELEGEVRAWLANREALRLAAASSPRCEFSWPPKEAAPPGDALPAFVGPMLRLQEHAVAAAYGARQWWRQIEFGRPVPVEAPSGFCWWSPAFGAGPVVVQRLVVPGTTPAGPGHVSHRISDEVGGDAYGSTKVRAGEALQVAGTPGGWTVSVVGAPVLPAPAPPAGPAPPPRPTPPVVSAATAPAAVAVPVPGNAAPAAPALPAAPPKTGGKQP